MSEPDELRNEASRVSGDERQSEPDELRNEASRVSGDER